MISLDFDARLAYPDDTEIILPIAVERQDGSLVSLEVSLDTGASMSMFGRGLADEIGVNVDEGERRTVRQLDASPVHAFVHTLTVHVLGYRLRAPVLFSDEVPEGARGLLGLIGVLDQIDVAIVHRERTLYVRASNQG